MLHHYVGADARQSRKQPAKECRRCRGSAELCNDKGGNVLKSDARESVRQGARQSDRWVGEGSRGGEPIRSNDIRGDREWYRSAAGARTAPNHGHKSKSRDELAEDL